MYKVERQDGKWCIVDEDGETVKCYDTESQAKAAMKDMEQEEAKEDIPVDDEEEEDPPPPKDAAPARKKRVKESTISEIFPLNEAAKVPKGGRATVKLIQPGWGSSGYYPAEVLKRDGPTVFVAGTQMYIDHPMQMEERERPERSVHDLAAKLTSDAYWGGDGLYAEAEIYPHHKELINAIWPDIGVSIRARGASRPGEAEGRKGMIIEKISDVASFDFVTRAGAGGRIAHFIESSRIPMKQTSSHQDTETLQEKNASLQEAIETQRHVTEQMEQRLKEMEEQNSRLHEAILMRDAQSYLVEKLQGYSLPDVTRDRLTRQLSTNPPISEGVLDKTAYAEKIKEAVQTEVAYLQSVSPSGTIRGMGLSHNNTHDQEQLTASLATSLHRLGMSEKTAELAARKGGN